MTTTGVLGTQADISLFSIVRNNAERQVGAVGSLQDLNIAILRAKEKYLLLEVLIWWWMVGLECLVLLKKEEKVFQED